MIASKIILKLMNLASQKVELSIYRGKKKIKTTASTDDLINCSVVFLITPGRSGTKSLIDYLQRYSEYCALHSPTPWLASIGSKFWRGDMDEAAACWAYYACREKYLKFSFERNMNLIDGDCKNLPILPALANFMPGSKFVHVVRDPVKFICSGLDRGYYKDKNPEFWGHLLRDREAKPAVIASNQISFHDQVKLIADFWQISNEIADQIHGIVGDDRFALIKSESMFKDSQVINNGFNSLGLEPLLENVIAGKMRVMNQNRTRQGYDISLIKSAIEDRCPSAKSLYPESLG